MEATSLIDNQSTQRSCCRHCPYQKYEGWSTNVWYIDGKSLCCSHCPGEDKITWYIDDKSEVPTWEDYVRGVVQIAILSGGMFVFSAVCIKLGIQF